MKYITIDQRMYGCDSGCEGCVVVILDENKKVISESKFEFHYIDNEQDIDLAIDCFLEKNSQYENLERLYDVGFYKYELE